MCLTERRGANQRRGLRAAVVREGRLSACRRSGAAAAGWEADWPLLKETEQAKRAQGTEKGDSHAP